MFAALFRWRERRRVDRATVLAAIRHFETIANRRAIRGMSWVVGADKRGSVVRVSYGDTRPPQRAWYSVAADGSVIAELSFDEVRKFGERGWR